jgi:hypothetical protein
MRLLNTLKERYYFRKASGQACPVYVYANRKNAGDFLSAKGIQAVVGLKGPEYLIEGNDMQTFLKSFRDKNVNLIIGGGGLLHGAFADFWEALELSGKPYLLFGIGVCDIKNRNSLLAETLLKQVILRAEHAWVRDSLTADLFHRICGRKPYTVLCPSVHYIVKHYASLVEKKVKSGKQTILYVHHRKLVHASGQREDYVRDAVRKICEHQGFMFKETDNVGSDPEKLLLKYLHADIIVSTRLHGCIFSYALNKPFIAVSADRKIDSFVHDYCNAPLLEMHELTADSLCSALGNAVLRLPRRDDFPILLDGIEKTGAFIRKQFTDKAEQDKLPF